MRKLFAAILNAGTDYLHLDLSMVPKGFVNKSVRPEILMEDMFTGGIYGFGENNDRKLAGFFCGSNRFRGKQMETDSVSVPYSVGEPLSEAS